MLGQVYTPEQLENIERIENEKRLKKILDHLFVKNQDSLQLLMDNEPDKYALLQDKLIEQAYLEYHKKPVFKFSEEQRKAYTTIGGIPELDGNYTVFGEVIEGFDVLDKMANAAVGFNNRPVEDIKIKVRVVK